MLSKKQARAFFLGGTFVKFLIFVKYGRPTDEALKITNTIN